MKLFVQSYRRLKSIFCHFVKLQSAVFPTTSCFDISCGPVWFKLHTALSHFLPCYIKGNLLSDLRLNSGIPCRFVCDLNKYIMYIINPTHTERPNVWFFMESLNAAEQGEASGVVASGLHIWCGSSGSIEWDSLHHVWGRGNCPENDGLLFGLKWISVLIEELKCRCCTRLKTHSREYCAPGVSQRRSQTRVSKMGSTLEKGLEWMDGWMQIHLINL